MGIGLLITLVGLENAKLIVSSPATLVTFGKLGPESLIAMAGLLLSAWLMAKKIKGAFLLGIIFCTVAAVLAGLVSPARALGGRGTARIFQDHFRPGYRRRPAPGAAEDDLRFFDHRFF